MSAGPDIAVVGAGPVGAALALLLARRGLQVVVVDAAAPVHRPGTSGYEARTLAIAPASRQVLLDLDAWPDGAEPYTGMTVWDARDAELAFTADEVGVDALGWIIEHGRLATALWQAMADTPGITVLAPAKVKGLDPAGGGYSLRLEDGQRIQPGLLVAADGGDSSLRQAAGLATDDWDTGHAALATVVATAQPHRGIAWQRFLEDGPLAFLPLPDRDGQHWCSIVWSQPPAEAKRRVALDDAAFCAELAEAFQHRLGAVLACDRRFAFPLRQRHAEAYHKANLVLVGDAAHVVHPMAGQGMNLGFRDAVALDAAVGSAGRLDLTGAVLHGVLQRYQRNRAGDNLGMLAALAGLQGVFGAGDSALARLRSTGLAGVASQPALKRRLVAEAMGVG